MVASGQSLYYRYGPAIVQLINEMSGVNGTLVAAAPVNPLIAQIPMYASRMTPVAAGITEAVESGEFSCIPSASKASIIYTPNRTLPVDKWGVPLPDVNLPHTQLGRSLPKYGSEPQAREWNYGINGNLQPIRDFDFTHHDSPSIHPNPHQHIFTPNNPILSPQGGYRRGNPTPI